MLIENRATGFDQGLVGPVCSVEHGFELCWWYVAKVAVPAGVAPMNQLRLALHRRLFSRHDSILVSKVRSLQNFQEAVGLGGGVGGLAERSFEVGVALAGLAGLAGALFGPGLDGAWGQLRPGNQVRGGGESGHVQSDLGEDGLRGLWLDARYLVEPLDHVEVRAFCRSVVAGLDRVHRWGAGSRVLPGLARISFGCAPAGPPGICSPGMAGGSAHAGGERADLDCQRVHLGEQHPGQFGVVLVELAVQSLDQGGILGSHIAAGQRGKLTRVTLAGDKRLYHVAHRPGVHRRGDQRHLDQGVFEQLLQPLPLAGAVPVQIDPQPGVVTQLPIGARATKLGRSKPFR